MEGTEAREAWGLLALRGTLRLVGVLGATADPGDPAATEGMVVMGGTLGTVHR